MRDAAGTVTLHLPAVAKMSCLGGTLEALASDITTGSPGSPGSAYCQLSTILKTSATFKAQVALGAVSDRIDQPCLDIKKENTLSLKM